MDDDKKVEIEKVNIEKRFDGSAFGSAVVKYVAYLAVFFGLMYFIVVYILPMFKQSESKGPL